MASYTAGKHAFKWQLVFSRDPNTTGQTVIHSAEYPTGKLAEIVDSDREHINDLFFAEDHWVLHTSSQARKKNNQAIRSRENWDDMGAEIQALGKEKWRINCITWGTGDWVTVLDRPVRDAKPTTWFGGSFDGAKKWLASKGPDYFVDYCTWVDEQQEYYLAATLDPEQAATQHIFFTACYPLADPAVAEHIRTHQVVQLAGGVDGWIIVFGPPAEASLRTISSSRTFPHDLIREKEAEGLWLQCIRFVPEIGRAHV